eukprot:jgi/Ulvmu1/3620/UM017_0032.1
MSELCKQRWLLNLIGGVEGLYQDTILDLHEERNRLEVSMQQMRTCTDSETGAARADVAAAEARAAAAAADAAAERQGRLAAEADMERMQGVLQEAQAMARRAAVECAQLHATVLSVSEDEARAQKQLAMRSHQLRELVVAAKCEMRTSRGTNRRQQVALASVKRLHDDTLKDQAEQYKDALGQAKVVERENEVLKARVECLRGELAAAKQSAAVAKKFHR